MAKQKRFLNMSATEALKLKGTPTAAAKFLAIPRTTFNSRLASEDLADIHPTAEDVDKCMIFSLRGQIKSLSEKLKFSEMERIATEEALQIAREVAAPVKLSKYKPSKRKKSPLGSKIAFIPDVQAKEGVELGHMRWAGEYVADKRPDTIVFAGDVWDMPSLSSYDKGKRQFEGRRYKIDIEAGKAAMELFLAPVRKAKGYRPRIVLTLGNHENRVNRAVDENAVLDGTIGTQDFQLEAMGIEAHPFLSPVTIDGVTFNHFFPRSARGAIVQTVRGAPSATAQLVRQGGSAIAGHAQGLDASPLFLNGRLQWGIIAGSFYQHEEEFLSPGGTVYWRGIVMLHEVMDGKLNPMFVTLDYLRERHG